MTSGVAKHKTRVKITLRRKTWDIIKKIAHSNGTHAATMLSIEIEEKYQRLEERDN